MTRVNINAIAMPGPLATTLTTITWTACDVAGMNETALTGKEQILIQNTDVAPQTFTVTSRPIGGRSGDIAGVSIAAAGFRTTQIFSKTGWNQSGKLQFAASHAGVKVAILRHK